MKIRKELTPEMSIEQFADANDLEMVIHERSKKYCSSNEMRFYARFDKAEIGGDGMLRGAYGNGSTPEKAIEEYAQVISEEFLIISANQSDRREIRVPRLI